MSSSQQLILGEGAGGAPAAYQIERSLRFNSADSAYLNRTPASAGNRKKWTWSGWVKRSQITPAADLMLFRAVDGVANFNFYFKTDDALGAESGPTNLFTSTPVYRDVSAWYHIVLVFDSDNATAANRCIIYINNVSQAQASGSVGSGDQLAVNAAVVHYIGGNNADRFFNGYLTEINFIDGQALTPSSFGEYNPDTGVWQPIEYAGTYGTNGFYLNFSDNSNTTAATLGKDYSGNGNNWTPNNFSVTAGAGNDSLVDTPTPYGTDTGAGGEVRGNYCTLNPLDTNGANTFTNGNLNITVTNGETNVAVGTIGVSSGKWYWEVTPTSGTNGMIGISNVDAAITSSSWASANGWAYHSLNGNKFHNSSNSAYGASYTTNDVIGVALDVDAGTLVFYKNGSSQGTAYSSGIYGKTIVPMVGNGANGEAQGYAVNFGQRPFAYTAPSGFKAFCTQNLPTPTIGATATTRADRHFTTNLWAGNNGSQTITNNIDTTNGGGLIWFKGRNLAISHFVVNSNSGYTKFLAANTTAAEDTYDFGFTPSTTGFSFNNSSGSVNQSGYNYVAWQWKANGAGSLNNAGSIQSTVSASTTAGFSIVSYTGTGSNATVGHGLSVAPSFIIVKVRSTAGYDWRCFHTSLGATQYIDLQSTAAAATASTIWQNTAPTSTLFSIGTNGSVNANTQTIIAYCFAPVAGYSAFGSYLANANADGPFIYTGFRPAFVLIKRSSVGGAPWSIVDAKRNTYNAVTLELDANSSDAEFSAGSGMDFVSNGFKLRDSAYFNSDNGNTFIYAAFAEFPFKFSLAR